MQDKDTIAAVATASGAGGIGIVRISGPGVARVATGLLGGLPKPRLATFSEFRGADGTAIDSGIAIYFPSPASYTGEDVLELQGHGGTVVLHMVLERCLSLGARLARPGEYTERAFLNDKLDLVQAEAVADLINSGTQQAVRAAQKSLQGEFSERVSDLVEQLVELRTYVESAIDFPDEEIDFLGNDQVLEDLNVIRARVRELLVNARQGCLLNEGLSVVLAGKPNAGKSSLLNALAKIDRAIVSDAPGTTRDTIELDVNIDGLPVTLVDTAGLREAADEVETEGVRRALKAAEQADLILYIVDDRCGDADMDIAGVSNGAPCVLVFNKIDLTDRPPGDFVHGGRAALAISATSGAGLNGLREFLTKQAGYSGEDGSGFLARTRHLDAIKRAEVHLSEGRNQLIEAGAGELLAEELRLAQLSLSEITGEFTSEDLLGRIFSTFCIGK